ncbi:MAG TPA: hypothetical protein VFB90_08250 [Dehalococcoidia bacterium]|nr:hypothetical protein [Dehalococcoidia bacterium]
MAGKRLITRAEAEKLIGEHQLRMMREHDCLSTWELYVDFGVGPCCGGIFRLTLPELRHAYHRAIPDIESLEREELLRRILRFEREKLGGRPITCSAVAQQGRVCDGLDRYTNQELSWLFPQLLGGLRVVDDPLTLDEAAEWLGTSVRQIQRLVAAGDLWLESAGPIRKVPLAALELYEAEHTAQPA